jgi:hypothetical protein
MSSPEMQAIEALKKEVVRPDRREPSHGVPSNLPSAADR